MQESTTKFLREFSNYAGKLLVSISSDPSSVDVGKDPLDLKWRDYFIKLKQNERDKSGLDFTEIRRVYAKHKRIRSIYSRCLKNRTQSYSEYDRLTEMHETILEQDENLRNKVKESENLWFEILHDAECRLGVQRGSVQHFSRRMHSEGYPTNFKPYVYDLRERFKSRNITEQEYNYLSSTPARTILDDIGKKEYAMLAENREHSKPYRKLGRLLRNEIFNRTGIDIKASKPSFTATVLHNLGSAYYHSVSYLVEGRIHTPIFSISSGVIFSNHIKDITAENRYGSISIGKHEEITKIILDFIAKHNIEIDISYMK